MEFYIVQIQQSEMTEIQQQEMDAIPTAMLKQVGNVLLLLGLAQVYELQYVVTPLLPLLNSVMTEAQLLAMDAMLLEI